MNAISEFIYKVKHYFDDDFTATHCKSEEVACSDEIKRAIGLCEWECDNSMGAQFLQFIGVEDERSIAKCKIKCPDEYKDDLTTCKEEYEFCLDVVADKKGTATPRKVEIVYSGKNCSSKKADCYEEANKATGGCKWNCQNSIKNGISGLFGSSTPKQCAYDCDKAHSANIEKCSAEHDKCVGN